MSKHDKELVAHIASLAVKAGYRAFIAESGTYGFFTNQEGSHLVSFQSSLELSFLGNYRAIKHSDGKSVGSGWRMDYSKIPQNVTDIRALFDTAACPPRWATNGLAVRLTNLEQHQKTYQSSSRYTEVTA